MPNSILWIGLVVLWVFVLFPMLTSRHPRIRQHTDAALSTRVLHRGDAERRTRTGPASGHDTDPDYVPVRRKHHHSDDPEDRMTRSDDSTAESDDEDFETARERATDTETHVENTAVETTAVETAAEVRAEPADAVEPGEPSEADDIEEFERPRRAPIPRDRDDDESDPDEDFVPSRRGRGGYDPEADAIARAARYTFRQRAVLGLVLSTLMFAGAGLALSSALWSLCAISGTILVAYMAYLRRQVHLEEDIRRRRAARLARKQSDDEAEEDQRTPEREQLDKEATRTQLRRAVLVEPDDEDPAFDHLELFDAATARATRQRATGGRDRRAVGE
ncbi:gephyrin-like molybdotransferase receptor GlpR [Nocardia sp. NPDC051030]|uniref:divisome protein SepX/GlpR n=1 Tax=Nocardia sp. NPDC051030 TaxID=3155162 RepID=UPI003434C0B4